MIINQTTTLIFEYPQDYLQEQEWCKTKEDRWIHKGTDTLGAVYENTISYSIGQPSNSEKPNNCEECEHWNDTEDGCADRHGCKTEPTISKMEQVDEPQTYVINPQEPTNDDKCFECDDFFTCGGQCNKIEDEPRLTAKCLNCANGGSYKCSKCDGEMYYKYDKDEPLKTTDYCDICKRDMCEVCIADATNPYCVPSHYEINYEPKDEPQTEEPSFTATDFGKGTITRYTDEPQTERSSDDSQNAISASHMLRTVEDGNE